MVWGHLLAHFMHLTPCFLVAVVLYVDPVLPAICAARQVFALTKERDALKRTAAAASAGGSTAAEVAQLRGQLHKKDELVAQVRGWVCAWV